MKIIAQILIEFLGVFFLCIFGGISTIYLIKNEWNFKSNSLISISLVHTFTLYLFINIGFYFECGHLNPAVSISLLIIKKLNILKCWTFIFFQFLGSFCAGYFFKCFSNIILINSNTYYGSPSLNTTFFKGVLSELLGTFLLVWVIIIGVFYKNKLHNEVISLIISLVFGINYLTIRNLTGCALNPARVFGPLFFSNKIDQDFLVYLLGPILGGILASILFFLARKKIIDQSKILKLEKLKNKELIID